jgi:3-hydroxyacyl-CoA dehydrogenase
MVVELMTDGFTEATIFPFLVRKMKETGTLPYVARKESTGFIFNRFWAAVKREVLMTLSEDVSVLEEIDSMWMEVFIKGRATPCDTMDQVGLDTVSSIEQHYIDERGLQSEHTVESLKKNYLDHGKLGNKFKAGGLFPSKPHDNDQALEPTLIVLDAGLSAEDPCLNADSVLHLSPSGAISHLVSQQSLPDGIDVDHTTKRMFWTCMGTPSKRDGTISSA